MDARDAGRTSGVTGGRTTRRVRIAGVIVGWLALAMTATQARQPSDPPSPRTDNGVAVSGPDGRAATALPAVSIAPPLTTSGPAAAGGPPSGATKNLDLGPAVLKSAITAADTDYARTDAHSSFGVNAPSAQAGIEHAFEEAQIERCGTPEGAFRFEPPVIGPVPLGGLLVAPFWLHAIATGRCSL